MNILYLNNNEKFIAYNKHNATKKKAPYVIFIHGFMSNMHGDKAIYLEQYCIEQDYNFIRFDNFGCGDSYGSFADQTISTWQQGLQMIINMIDGPIILVGSSLGAWVAFISVIKNPDKISGIVTIAAAFDFTQELIYEKLSPKQMKQLDESGSCNFSGSDKNCSHIYPISKDLIEDGRQHLLLSKEEININCPIHLIHGMQDFDVPYSISMRAINILKSQNIVFKLIKDGDHRLSRAQDLKIICNSIEEIINSLI